MQEFIVDACILTGFVAGEKSGTIFAQYLDRAFEGEILLLANTVNLGEFYYSCCKYEGEAIVETFLDQLRVDFNLKIITPTYDDCLESAKYKAKGGIAYFDCFNLVLAKKYPKATILTLDSEYKKFAKEFKIKFL